ncbi:MAG: hypothetical protein ACI4PE_05370 [Bacilli bacterium]
MHKGKKILYSVIILSLFLFSTIYTFKKLNAQEEKAEIHKIINDIDYSKSDLKEYYIASEQKLSYYNGGYSTLDLTGLEPNLFSTHYILESIELLNKNPYKINSTNLESFINETLEAQKESPTLIYDLYYASLLVKEYNLKNSNLKRIISDNLAKLKTKENIYKFSINDSDTENQDNLIFSTYYAYKTLSNLNIPKAKELNLNWLENLQVEEDKIRNILYLYKLKSEIDINTSIDKIHVTLFKNYLKEIPLSNYNLYDINTCFEIIDFLEKNEIDYTFDKGSIYKKIINEQNSDYGWDINFGENSNEQAIYIVLNFLNFFNLDIPNHENILNLLIRQENINGGFIPIVNANFSMEKTYVLSYLNKFYNIKGSNYELTIKKLQSETLVNKDLNLLSEIELIFLVGVYENYMIPPTKEMISELEKRLNELLYMLNSNSSSNYELLFYYVEILHSFGIDEYLITQIVDLFSNKVANLDYNDVNDIFLLATVGKVDSRKIDNYNFVDKFSNNPLYIYLYSIILKNAKDIPHDLHVSIRKSLLSSYKEMLQSENFIDVYNLFYMTKSFENLKN